METLSLIASVLALVGTFIQMKDQLGQMSRTDPDGYAAFDAVEAQKPVHSEFRHPILWWRQQRTISALLASSPIEAEAYRRATRLVKSWGALTAAALLFFVGALWSEITWVARALWTASQ